MVQALRRDFVFRRNGRVHLNRRGRQFSRLLAAEVGPSAAVMLDTPFSEVAWRVLATYSIPQFPLHFPSHASPCSITFQLDSTTYIDTPPTVLMQVAWFWQQTAHTALNSIDWSVLLKVRVCLLWGRNWRYAVHNNNGLVFTIRSVLWKGGYLYSN
jgi:hypothetical protein